MTEKELKAIMGKQYNFSDALMIDYKRQLLEGKLDVYGLESMLEMYQDFSSLLKKPSEYKYFYLDDSAKFLLNNPFVMVDVHSGKIRGFYVDPKECEVSMVSDKVFRILSHTYVNGLETFENVVNLNSVYIVPFVSVYCAMAALSRHINGKEGVSEISLSDGRLLVVVKMFSNWVSVFKGLVMVTDILGGVHEFSILDIESIRKV